MGLGLEFAWVGECKAPSVDPLPKDLSLSRFGDEEALEMGLELELGLGCASGNDRDKASTPVGVEAVKMVRVEEAEVATEAVTDCFLSLSPLRKPFFMPRKSPPPLLPLLSPLLPSLTSLLHLLLTWLLMALLSMTALSLETLPTISDGGKPVELGFAKILSNMVSFSWQFPDPENPSRNTGNPPGKPGNPPATAWT